MPSCRDALPVGARSSRQQRFVDAFNRNGGKDKLGCTENGAHWWGSGSNSVVIQDFTGSSTFGDAAIIHDEPREPPNANEHPEKAVPAYVVHGGIWGTYTSIGGPNKLGPPTSDEFVNQDGDPQSNFRDGYIVWNRDRPEKHDWPKNGAGWRAEYHNGRNLNAFPTWVQYENTTNIDRDWGTNAPGGNCQLTAGAGCWGVWRDKFSVRWTKTVSFDAGRYRFHTWSDDGVRLWIDGQPIINEWHSGGSQSHDEETTLTGGNHLVRLEYFEDSGPAYVRLTWEKLPEPNRPPNKPTLAQPHNGDTIQGGNVPTLCWNNNGDPDDAPATLRFKVEVGGTATADSGWVRGACWRPGNLDGREGDYTWKVRGRDPGGLEKESDTWRFSIRNNPPRLSFNQANSHTITQNNQTIQDNQRNWTFSGTAEDPDGSVDRVEFNCAGDNCNERGRRADGTTNWSHNRNGLAGKNRIYFFAYDNRGKQSSENNRHSINLWIDDAAPRTSLSLNGESNSANWPAWFRSPVQVRLHATDQSAGSFRSGIKELHYRCTGPGCPNNGVWQTQTGDKVTFTVADDGSYTAEYYAVDNVGNQQSAQSRTFKIDQTPPSPPGDIKEIHGVVSGQWQKDHNTPTFTWAASTDPSPGSGVWGYQFYFGTESNGTTVHHTFTAGENRTWTPKPNGVRTGTYYLRGRTRDNAGNWSPWTTLFTFRYDGTPPENPEEATHAAGITNNTWQRATRVADFTWPKPHDEGSGIKGYQVFWGNDPEGASTNFITTESFADPTPLCGENEACTGYLRLRSVDNVDNPAEDWSTAFVLRYDNVPPTADFTFNGGVTRTTQTLITLNITASDQGSGVRTMRVSNHSDFRDAQWEVYNPERLWAIPAISRRAWPVYLQVKDGVDLVSDVISHTIYLDVNPEQPRSVNFRLFDRALSAGASAYTSTTYSGRGTLGQVVDSEPAISLNYTLIGGYEAGSQALPVIDPGHDDFTFVNGIFASGMVADTLRSPLYQMRGTVGEMGVPNNETTLQSQNHRFQPGFLAAKPPAKSTPTPTPIPGQTPTPEPKPACEFPQISINAGALFTNNTETTLSICAPRAEEMMISNDGGFVGAQWEPYAESKPWTITTYGQYVLPRFVYAAFKDTDGTVHGVYFDDIIYDPNPPEGTLAIGDSVPATTLIQSMTSSRTAKEPGLLSTGETVKYVQRLGGRTLDQPMALLSTQQEGTIDVYLNAQDDISGLQEMQIGTAPDFSDTEWEPFSAVKAWTPTGFDGEKTLYARFRDGAGNVSEPAQASFILDTVRPIGGLLTTRRMVGPNIISTTLLLDAVDNFTGVADVRISTDPEFTDAAWQPYTSTLTWPISAMTGPEQRSASQQNEETLYAQYRDLAGNVSEVYSDTYQIDTTPPALYVEVSPADILTRTVTVLAYDGPFDEGAGVAKMYLSNDPLMLDGVVTLPYSEAVEWVFDERRVVWVQVEDWVGNVTEPYPVYAPPICDLAGNDGIITAADMATLTLYWREETGLPYDRDGDNRVTVADIMWYASRWGQSCQ